MASNIGGGLGGAVGLAQEVTYGTWVGPTTWIEVHSAKLQQRPHYVQGTGLANSRSVDLQERYINPWFDAGGDVEMEVLTSKFALIQKNIMGSNVSSLTQISSTGAYTLSTVYGVPDNQNYLSLQALVPAADASINRENFHGCVIQKASFSVERGGILTCQMTIDSQYVESTTAAGTPAYTTTAFPFNGGANNLSTSAGGMTFAVGNYLSEAALDGVKKFTLDIERTLATERIYIGNQFKEMPVTNGITKITGSLDVELLTAAQRAQIWDLMNSEQPISILATFTGSPIASSGFNNSLIINPTSCRIMANGTPELDGPEVVTATLNFVALIDTNNDTPLSMYLTTGDTTF